MRINLEKNGVIKNVPTGFSWKSLLFGCLYPLSKSDWIGVFIQLVLAMLTFGFSALVVPFTYNKKYIQRLLDDGYKPYEYEDKSYLVSVVGVKLAK